MTVNEKSSGSRTARLAAASAVVLACLAVIPGLRWQAEADDLRAERDDRAAALDVAVEAAELLLGLDADSASESLTRLRSLATGDFAEQVDVLADTVAGVLRKGQVGSSGEVTAAGVERTASGGAVVLVAAMSLVSNAELPAGELRTFRMAIELSDDGGDWQVSHVEFLS